VLEFRATGDSRRCDRQDRCLGLTREQLMACEVESLRTRSRVKLSFAVGSGINAPWDTLCLRRSGQGVAGRFVCRGVVIEIGEP
jgi:hypothetical protein